jgi:hypothetical protein
LEADKVIDLTSMAMNMVTGKEPYEFEDLTRKIATDVFDKDKK